MTDTDQGKPKRDSYVSFWTTQAGADAIDGARGTWSRSEFVRQAVRTALRSGLKGPTPPKVEF